MMGGLQFRECKHNFKFKKEPKLKIVSCSNSKVIFKKFWEDYSLANASIVLFLKS